MVDWKKEISFGGKKRPQPEQPQEPQAEQPRKEPSVWKKEISFRRKPKDAAPGEERVRALDVDVPAAVELVQAFVPHEPVADTPLVADVVVEQPAAPETATGPIVDLADLVAAAPEASPAPIAAASPLPVVAPPPLAPAAEVVVHPPVPAAQLPPLADEKAAKRAKTQKKKEKNEKQRAEKPQRERTPFYRRELSFGRKKNEAAAAGPADETTQEQPKQPKEPKQPKPKRERRSLSLPRPAPRASGGGGKVPKRVVGLKIGASQIAAATVANNGHSEVVQLARAALDPGIVAAGELREPDLLADALKEFFQKNKLPKRGVRLGIATNRIGVRTLEIAGIDDAKQLANAIRFRAQEALPIPIDEAVLDYQVLSESKNEQGETTRRILLVLAYRDLIDRYVSACRKAGIQLVGIDLEAFALLRAIAAPREEAAPAQAALVAVTVGHDRTTFAVSDGRVCEFTRVLDWGGHSLDVALARALDMAPSDVDPIKRQLSLHGTERPEALTDEQAHAARDALLRQVQSFARELVSSLQFYQNQPNSLGIGEIVLTGGTAHFGGFAEELQRLIGVRVRVADPLVRVKVSKKLREPEQVGSLAVAIGLGIED